MKKRKIAVLIGLFACALLALGLAACGHQHTYGAGWTYDATHHWHEATCEHTGEKDGYAEHTWDGGTVTTAATCTEAGEKTYTCTVCSATKTEVIAATGHSYAKEWSSDNTHHWHEATCEHSEETEGKAEHTWDGGTVTTAATCTEAGEKTYTCTVCSATKTEVIAATGHSYAKEWSSDNTHHWHEATCEHTGEKDGYAEHTWDSGTVTTAAMCETAGVMTYTCTACNSTKQETVPATGHVWNDGEVTTPAGCLTDGTTTYTCTVCSATKTEPIPATGNHAWNGGTVTTAATCTEAGEKTYTCTVCSATKTEVIAATGHSYAKEWSSDNTHHWHAATCGHDVKEDYAEHVFEKGVCTTCGCTQPVTEGLAYTLINNDTEYEVSGIGTATGSEIFIPSAHNGLPVTSIETNAFYGCGWIKSVFIPDSITSIGDVAFAYCNNLTSIVIPDSVTSIGDGAFSGCHNLASIVIPDSVMSIGDGAFGYCYSLTSIIIPESVTSIGDLVFDGCDNLASITVAEGNSVYHSAGNCLIETASKTLIAGHKTSVIPADGSVTVIGEGAFSYCDGLTSIVIPDSITSIGSYAFSNCNNLTSVTIGSGVQSIGSSAFSYCYKLVEVYNKSALPITAGGTDHGEVARYALNVYTQEGGSQLTDTSDGYRFYYDGSKGYLVGYHGTETALTLPASFTTGGGALIEEYEIAKRAFYGCTALKSVTIPDSVTVIGENAFSDCYGLTSVIIPDSVTYIADYAFVYCEGLTSIIIPNSVTSIGNGAFRYCNSLTSVTIGRGVTSIGNYAFESCYKLVEVYNKSALSITAGGTDHGEVARYALNVYTQEGGSQLTDTSDGYRFYYDGSKGYLVGYHGTETALTLPASFTAYNGTLVEKYEIAERAFYGCTALKSVTISESVTVIGEDAFTDCTSLTSVIIPDSVTSIGNFAFVYCYSLTSIVIPDSVTSIGEGTFAGCINLASIVIPNSVTSIGDMAFVDCNTLEAVYYRGTATQWQAVTIGFDPFLSTATVYCYSETQPTDTGNYWHYGTDGVTPVKW